MSRGTRGKAPRPQRAKGNVMTNKKNAITRADALTVAIDLMNAHGGYPEHVEVLKKVLASITRKPEKSGEPTKAQLENMQLFDAAYSAMPDEPVTAKWFTDHVRGILTPQKAVAVLNIGLKNGMIRKTYEGRTTLYAKA